MNYKNILFSLIFCIIVAGSLSSTMATDDDEWHSCAENGTCTDGYNFHMADQQREIYENKTDIKILDVKYEDVYDEDIPECGPNQHVELVNTSVETNEYNEVVDKYYWTDYESLNRSYECWEMGFNTRDIRHVYLMYSYKEITDEVKKNLGLSPTHMDNRDNFELAMVCLQNGESHMVMLDKTHNMYSYIMDNERITYHTVEKVVKHVVFTHHRVYKVVDNE